MGIALWVMQVLLALAFGMAGVMKSTRPIGEIAKLLLLALFVAYGRFALAPLA